MLTARPALRTGSKSSSRGAASGAAGGAHGGAGAEPAAAGALRRRGRAVPVGRGCLGKGEKCALPGSRLSRDREQPVFAKGDSQALKFSAGTIFIAVTPGVGVALMLAAKGTGGRTGGESDGRSERHRSSSRTVLLVSNLAVTFPCSSFHLKQVCSRKCQRNISEIHQLMRHEPRHRSLRPAGSPGAWRATTLPPVIPVLTPGVLVSLSSVEPGAFPLLPL